MFSQVSGKTWRLSPLPLLFSHCFSPVRLNTLSLPCKMYVELIGRGYRLLVTVQAICAGRKQWICGDSDFIIKSINVFWESSWGTHISRFADQCVSHFSRENKSRDRQMGGPMLTKTRKRDNGIISASIGLSLIGRCKSFRDKKSGDENNDRFWPRGVPLKRGMFTFSFSLLNEYVAATFCAISASNGESTLFAAA